MKDAEINQILKGNPVNFNIVGFGNERSFTSKDGREFNKKEVNLEIPSTGRRLTAEMFKNFVQHLRVGGMVRGEAGEKYPEWHYINMGEAALEEKTETVYQDVKNEGNATDNINEVVISQITHGFMEGAISTGKSPKEARKIAYDAYFEHDELVEEIVKFLTEPDE